MPQPSDMTGKVAIVTGAAAGLGRGTALILAQAGAHICLVDIDAAKLDAVAAEVRALGVEALVQAVDLSQSDVCKAVVAATHAKFGRVDALCNVAGVMIPAHSAEMPVSAFEKTLAVNLAAPFYLIQAALPYLLEAKGAVVNVASAVGITAQAYTAAYCASKAGLIHMTKSLAVEYLHQPIRFNVVAPGGMMTELARNMVNLQDADRSLQMRVAPLRGLVEIDDVAEMVAFLATDAADGYHGSVIVIDKGITAG